MGPAAQEKPCWPSLRITKVVEEKVYPSSWYPALSFRLAGISAIFRDKDEKMKNWMQPIFDNLRFLVSANGGMWKGK